MNRKEKEGRGGNVDVAEMLGYFYPDTIPFLYQQQLLYSSVLLLKIDNFVTRNLFPDFNSLTN